MLKAIISMMLCTVAAFAVAVPPYEPLPGSPAPKSGSASSKSSQSSAASTQKAASDSGLGYAPAIDSGANANLPSGNANWETYSQIQQMQQELQEVRGMVEELNHQIRMMQKQERERYLDLDMRINELKGEGHGSSGGTVDDKALYDKSTELRKQGKFPESIADLNQLLKQSPKGHYAPYAEYWLGELYMATTPADNDKAKRHFINLLAGYPGHVKVPDAMYKLGKLYASQGETSKAKSTLTELVKKYPGKPSAQKADDLLKTL